MSHPKGNELSKRTPWCLFSFILNLHYIINSYTWTIFTWKYRQSYEQFWTIVDQKGQNPLNRRFAYPKHVTFFTHSNLVFFSVYPRLLHRITSKTIFRPPVPGINHCPRHVFVPFYFFPSLWVIPGSIQYWMIICINVRRHHLLMKYVCTYKIIKMLLS